MPSKGSKMVDFYRKIPTDLTEATVTGATMSICACVFMITLFIVEVYAFMSTSVETSVMLDTNAETQLRINFNITLMDLSCDYAAIDVVDVLGTNSMNVTSNIEKWQLDENGVRMIFQGRNREQKDITHDEHHPDIETLHENGIHAIPLSQDNFDTFLEENPYVFVNFFAPWCIWCQRLEPTWEVFAEEVEKHQTDAENPTAVDVVKVDCVANRELCTAQRIQAFPTLRFFKDKQQYGPDYKNDRTTAALMDFIQQKIQLEQKMKDWHPKRRERVMAPKEHPGCMVSGYVLVNRVPGNFHLEARSKTHNLNAAMTNLSHVVNHLSFGTPMRKDVRKKISKFPQFTEVMPLDGNVYVNRDFHQSHHHYSKVVSTHYEMSSMLSSASTILGYQMLTQSQIMHYDEMDVPEAKFSYDLSPMAVIVQNKGRHWYDFITSLCAIIGGTFTVVGIVDAVLHKIIKGSKQL